MQCARFDWHATREYLCTRRFVAGARVSLSLSRRFVSAGLPVCRGGTSRVIPTRRDGSEAQNEKGKERKGEKRTRDNDDGWGRSRCRKYQLSCRTSTSILIPQHSATAHCPVNGPDGGSELKFRSAIVLRSTLTAISPLRKPSSKLLFLSLSLLPPRRLCARCALNGALFSIHPIKRGLACGLQS